MDVGTSGGVWGLERGYCMMIGGDNDAVERLDPIFKTLAPGRGDVRAHAGPREDRAAPPKTGYLHCGPSGAGHFVKMVHNGIEYGLMAAYAEGLNILQHANVGKQDACQRRRNDAAARPGALPVRLESRRHRRSLAPRQRRRVVAARSHRDRACSKTRISRSFAGRVSDSGEGRWTIMAAIDEGGAGARAHAALYERFASRGEADFADKLLSAMRFEFGGHHEKKA